MGCGASVERRAPRVCDPIHMLSIFMKHVLFAKTIEESGVPCYLVNSMLPWREGARGDNLACCSISAKRVNYPVSSEVWFSILFEFGQQAALNIYCRVACGAMSRPVAVDLDV